MVESGEKNVGQWVEMNRNVYEDYRQIFDEDPPTITGIGIMTDSDSTQDQATAYYGNISFHSMQSQKGVKPNI